MKFMRAYVNCHARVADSEDTEADRDLHEALRQYFTLEGVGVSSFADNLPEPTDIARAKSLLASTTVKEGDRFATGLLWREDSVTFPDSYQMAEKRLASLERKMEKDPELKREVHAQVKMYVEKGFAHKATQEELEAADPNRSGELGEPIAVRCHLGWAIYGPCEAATMRAVSPAVRAKTMSASVDQPAKKVKTPSCRKGRSCSSSSSNNGERAPSRDGSGIGQDHL